MYNIKGPSKIVAKTTRRGISQNLEYNRSKSVENEPKDIINVPKPTFHKKSTSSNHRPDAISPQHEEIIKFINDSWNSVCEREGEGDSEDSGKSEQTVCYYEEEPCEQLQDFKPFDLESWWGKRLYAYITKN